MTFKWMLLLHSFSLTTATATQKNETCWELGNFSAHPPYFFSQGQQVHVELKTTVKPCSSFAAHHKNSNLYHEKGSVPRALQFSPLLGQCRCGMNRAEMLDRVNHAVELSLTPNPVQYINTSSRRVEEVPIKWLHLRADFSGSSGSLGTRMTSRLITKSFWGSSLFAACMEGGVFDTLWSL